MESEANGGDPETLARKYDMFARLCETVSQPGISSDVVQASVLQLVGGTEREQNVGAPIRGEIHVAVIADASVNFSRFLSGLEELAESSARLNGTSSTPTGAIGSVKGGSLSPGPLLDEDISFTFIEQADSLNSKTSNALQQILDTGTYSFTKSNFATTVDAPGSVFVSSNPEYETFDAYASVPDQISLPPSVAQSADLLLVNKGHDVDEFTSDENELPLEHALEYLQAARSLEPEWSTDTGEIIDSYVSKYESVASDAIDDPSMNLYVFGVDRVRESIRRLPKRTRKRNSNGQLVMKMLSSPSIL
ncbi:hypothetical protein ACFQHN_25575 [Natrialbaceae archaeon GCM10025896]